jgi:hypothetical protein
MSKGIKQGTNNNWNFVNRIGERRLMSNGLWATIIAYRSCMDIDIQFENNKITYNKTYQCFQRGAISSPMIYEDIGYCIKCINPNTIKRKTEFLIDKEDLDKVLSRFWCIEPFGYVISTNKTNTITLHKFLMQTKDNEYLDHINGDKFDNRKSNLRICTKAENCRNSKMKSINTSGYKGVSWRKRDKKWSAIITVNYKNIGLGYYENKIEAAKAYNKAALKYHGEFARLNII